MKKWEQLSDNAKDAMRSLGECTEVIPASDGLIKGWRHTDEGTYSFYMSGQDLRDMAAGCIEVAEWLEQRAKEAA